jgi:hypothetical protein
MIRLVTILSAILALTLRTPAQAAEFKVEWVNPEHTGASLTIKGNLERKDTDSFRAVAKELAYAREVMVELDSPGGDISVSSVIGETVHGEGWHTFVHDKVTCASACAFIWLAGKTRWYEGTAHIGFHGTREVRSWERSQRGDAFVTNYLKRIKVPDNIIAFALAAPPTEIRWLSEEAIKELALKVINKEEWDRMWIAITKSLPPVPKEGPDACHFGDQLVSCSPDYDPNYKIR